MKQRSQIFLGLRVTILAIVTILLSLGGSAYCDSADVSLLLQQIPAQGGTITPNVGVYQLTPNSEITLTANPKPGYRFICWLGDVSDPKSSSTVAYINGPKIIIALFERTEYEDLLPETIASGGGGGGGGGNAGSASDGSPDIVANSSGLMGGGGGKSKPKVFSPTTPSSPWPTDLDRLTVEPPVFLAPVQDEAVIPEPATAILLALGGLFTLIRRHKSEDRSQKTEVRRRKSEDGRQKTSLKSITTCIRGDKF